MVDIAAFVLMATGDSIMDAMILMNVAILSLTTVAPVVQYVSTTRVATAANVQLDGNLIPMEIAVVRFINELYYITIHAI